MTPRPRSSRTAGTAPAPRKAVIAAAAAPARRGRPPAGKPGNGTTGAALGGNIKSTRIVKGLKLRDLAARIGCSESLISKIENGKASPSLTMLHRIAHSLDITVTTLFEERGADRGIVARDGARSSFRIDKAGSQIERLVPPDGGHLLEGNLHILAPGGGSDGTLAHEGEECGFVIEGQLELTVGADVLRLAAGDSFVFRSEIPHSYRNPGRTRTRVVWVSTPPTF